MRDTRSHAQLAANDGPRLLLTGFGPFPGVPDNASANLVRRLVRALRRANPDLSIHGAILQTRWEHAPGRVARLIGRLRPALTLHFGVSAAAHGFVVERRAVNQCADLDDGAGDRPRSTLLDPHGRAVRTATVPVDGIVLRLRAAGLPASPSTDAGQYLCNAVLYRSLATGLCPAVGFIHIPSQLGLGCALTMPQALDGGLAIVAACLDAQALA